MAGKFILLVIADLRENSIKIIGNNNNRMLMWFLK